ncbi:glycosyltransferase involved in cell wall biosynthesis [Lactobacillus colini]|uniref:Glycosyltransferase involved in cell wall biosynthesis n=1 Tax=Lactobacillus colini TaxID=1819254 RepID=A0ABS4MEQ5_9LACO|nr:glycosyltransferase family A protein [Lactobacillus colini]MBP2058108.1 glycosyltransferase involved in cell wall biosynthesis [Lactobacillus colini]
MEISYIIPAHNCENTIMRTVKSIQANNDKQQYEIIIVENGSTDNTKKVLQKMLASFTNIFLFHSKKGVSNARNLGIKKARGKWLCFVDADDYIVSTPICNDNVDLVIFDYLVGNKDKKLFTSSQSIDDKAGIFELKNEFLSNPTRYMTVWSKLLKNTIIKENQIFFDPKLQVAEDSDFFYRYLKFCKSVLEIEKPFYHYSIDNESTIRSAKSAIVSQYIQSMQKMRLYKKDNRDSSSAINKYILIHQNVSIVRGVFNRSDISFIDKIIKEKKIRQNIVYKEALKEESIFSLCKVRFLPQLFFKVHLGIMADILYELRAKYNEKRQNNQR